MAENNLHRPGIVACVWDFDKTLINGYMQTPIFQYYGVDEERFWNEVNAMGDVYRKRDNRVTPEINYLNHILTHVRHGKLKGLSNKKLRELGKELQFYPGLPTFFQELKNLVSSNPEYLRHSIVLEHYIVSTGLSEMIRGSAVASFVEDIFGCEFVENPVPPGFLQQPELALEDENREIGQIGQFVDNTIKTRFLFEINKGSNKNPSIDVNAKMSEEDRRIPVRNMIYIADGPSDVPAFAVVRKWGGKAFAVYDPESEEEFAQNDKLLQEGRIHAYGPASYTRESSTSMWLRLHVQDICNRIVRERELALAERVGRPPRHIHRKQENPVPTDLEPEQGTLFQDESNHPANNQ